MAAVAGAGVASAGQGRAGTAANPTAVSADPELVAILLDPACPWERPGRIQVDRLLAFAFTQGADLRGLEQRMDRAIAELGGEREPLAPGSELPFYSVPLPATSARTASRVSASSGRLSSR